MSINDDKVRKCKTTFSMLDVEQACKNIGFDLSCGACAELFFTGSRTYEHEETCATWRDAARLEHAWKQFTAQPVQREVQTAEEYQDRLRATNATLRLTVAELTAERDGLEAERDRLGDTVDSLRATIAKLMRDDLQAELNRSRALLAAWELVVRAAQEAYDGVGMTLPLTGLVDAIRALPEEYRP